MSYTYIVICQKVEENCERKLIQAIAKIWKKGAKGYEKTLKGYCSIARAAGSSATIA